MAWNPLKRKSYVTPVGDLESWREEVLRSDGPVIVDFYANWCQPCRTMSGLIKEIAKEYEDEIKVVVVDIDRAEQIAKRNGIRSVPTTFVFRDGKPRGRFHGIVDKKTLVDRCLFYDG